MLNSVVRRQIDPSEVDECRWLSTEGDEGTAFIRFTSRKRVEEIKNNKGKTVRSKVVGAYFRTNFIL